MAWEQRGKKRYFYTTRRVNGRVVKIYHGNGEAARSLLISSSYRKRKTSCAPNRKWILWTNSIGALLSKLRLLK